MAQTEDHAVGLDQYETLPRRILTVWLPLFVFVFLVALGIDYNIFLMTRVREETVTRGTRRGSLIALASTGGGRTFRFVGGVPVEDHDDDYDED